MAASNYDIEVEQGGTFMFQMEFVKDGGVLPVTDLEFNGTVKNSVYDSEGFPFRFEKASYRTVNVYLDSQQTATMDFCDGVYDIQMIHGNGAMVTPFLAGKVKLIPRATRNG